MLYCNHNLFQFKTCQYLSEIKKVYKESKSEKTFSTKYLMNNFVKVFLFNQILHSLAPSMLLLMLK